ncbi:LOW QUALITY PROTEIN: uncharacterized protein LOC128219136 [Mya arenaria]|uniref:LOW QUALITY PROTEIN: uncharacterized protein LOC128219136 n=1 Tax=Mya arenaria TaxID=6604 RepID=UPI0022E8F551|nr:LOW QUALITY PROTEIN: uncharacterized protein LOC128219136 [Mya arenaria]
MAEVFRLSTDLGFCVIDGNCYFANDMNTEDNTTVCYPALDPYRWLKDLTLDRVPGDFCVPGENHCDSVTGGAYCDDVTKVCTCFETHTGVATECAAITCYDEYDSVCGQIANGECRNGACACKITAHVNRGNGACVGKVVGSNCNGDDECSSIEGSYCGTDHPNRCVCGELYHTIGEGCFPKGLGDTCVDDDGCSLVSNAGCYDQETGTNSLCECKFGYAENENRQCVSTGVITKPDPYNSQQWCYQDDDQCSASLWYTVCDDWYWQCVTRSCNASSEDGDASCMSKLLYCNAESGFCEPHLCSATDQRECKLDNSECDVDKGYCGCVDGYSIWNGDCSPVKDRACLDDTDCHSKKGRYVCSDNKCVCDSDKWVEDENGLCKSYVDQPCSSTTQCGKDSNTTCSDGQCECSAGFVLRDGACITVFLAGCNEDYDCSAMEGLECSSYAYYDDQFFGWNDPEYSGVCVCRPGYAPYARACKQVLGSQCDELKACGNASHWSYSYHYYSWGHYYAQYFKHYHSAFYCDVFDTCQCSRGYIKNADGTDCIALHDKGCTVDTDCGPLGNGYQCDISQCKCSQYFVEVSGRQNNNYYYWWYDSNGQSEYICTPQIGLSCNSYPCEVPGAFCDYSNSQAICSCEKGYEKSGQCTNYLGSYCTSDEVCSVVDHAHCNLEVEACTCINGFIEDHENDLCTPVLAQYCAGVVDCPMEGAVCDNNSCSCVTGTTEHNGQCFSNPDCAEDIPDLPDMRRRSSQYELSYNEPMINDDLLNAEWYNIGQNRISSAFITQSDVCGTKWPMFLTDSVPSLNDGESIETYFQIGGGSGITEQFPVTLRKCGMNNQIGLFDVPLAFSGFSLHHDVSSNPSKNSTGRWADIEQDLTYDSSDQPQIVFRCHALDTEHSYYPCSTCYDEFYFLNDGFYYTIHWYINDIECVTYGPLPRSDIRASNLLESVVMQECQQNVVGFDVQCSYEWSESVFGERSPPITSDKLTTGVKSRFLPVPSAGLLIEGVSETPIGCLDPYDLAFTCEVHWQLEGINCTGSTTPGADDHHLCGTTLIGLTITGLAHYSSWNGFIESYRSGYAYDATYGVMNTKAHKHIFEDGEYDLSDRFLEAYCPAATGHALWDGYTIPPTTISFDNSTDVGTFCQVTWNHQDNIPVLTKVKGDTSWEIPIDIVGEILLVRSLAYPMEVQIKTEVCSTSDNGVCVCAFTFRDGNRVYTVDTCSGVTREGFLWATYPDIPELSYTDSGLVRVLNGMEGMVDKNYTSKSLFANVSQVHSEEAFVDLDGICAFEDETFRRSTGGLMLNSEGFLNSWRVPVGDSLLEPNLSPTPYAYEEVLYDCGCPTSGDLIDTGETVNGTYGPVYVDSGATKCSKASSRSVNHTGEVWTGTVIPDFAIENVTLTFAYQESQSKKMTRMAICEFEGQEGFTYTISWYADTLKLHENSLQSLTTTGHNTVSMETLTDAYNSLKASGSSCIINRKLRCAVSVHNLNEVEVLPDSFSEPFEIFTVPESHISIPRGAHTILDVIVNLPLLCEDGKPCHLEIKVVDEDDSYDCSDSTLAIKHMQTCGDIIDGIRDPSELNTFNGARELALTTIKNNKYSLKDAFSLTLMTSMSGSIDSFWDDCTIEQTVHVFIRDVERDYWKGNYCYVTSDPYFRTFDGVYYSNQQLGDSILYVNDRYKTMVQITTQECWPGSTRSCTCATTVRVGRDVYTVGHCNGTHLIEWISEDDDVLDVYYMPGYMNRFYLPYGTIVEVTYYVSEWWSTMNVFVFPSPNDMEESGGLCGTFNGDYMDDFLHRDGIKTPLESQNWWWWVWGGDPDAFAGSWQAHEEESLLNIDYVDTLESYSNGENFCVCPLINGERLPLCNPKEDRICIGDAYATRPGNQVAKQNGRQRRSLDMEDHNAVYDVHDIRQRLDDLKHMRTKRGTVRVRRQATGDPVAANESYYRALAECEAEMTDSCNSEAAGSLSSVAGSAPNNCAQDKMVSPNATAAVDIACAGMQAATKREVERNITALAESAEAVNIIINACPDNCSSNGVCINGTCICDEGYDQELSNCKLAINLPPEVQSHVENCNPKISTCCYIRFTTVSGCSSNITCKQQLRKFYANNTHADEEDTKAGVCDDGWTAYCPVECAGSSRRRREAGENTLMGTASNVSLSNDNSSFSAPELVTVLDTACLTYDATSNSITLASDYCLVDGVCYGNYTAFDDCSVCDPNVDQFDWTLLSDKCQIGGVCYPSGNVSTDNCLYGCQPSVDQYIWTERSEVCQIESECYMDGVNKSATEDCLYCNVTVDQFAWTKQNASCYIADVCHYNGDSKSADEYCMECRPDTNQFDWSQTSDTCHIGGSCYDNDNTSTDTCLFCNATMDPNQWTQTTNSCMIDRACYYENATSTQTCQTCLPSADQTSWTLTSGYCIIEDVCYQTNTLNPTDECRYCNSDMDSTTWQTNTSQECQQQQEESGGSSVGIIAGAVVATAVVVGGVAAGIFIYKYMKKQNSITARASAGLFDSAGNKHFKLRVDQDPSASKSTSSAPPMPYKLPKEVLPQGTMSAPVNLYTDATGDHPAPAPVGALPPIIGLGGGPAPALNLPPAE